MRLWCGAVQSIAWVALFCWAALQSVVEPAYADPEAGGSGPEEAIVLVIGGDLGLGGSNQPLTARGGIRHGRTIPFERVSRGIRPLLDGDVNFANLETVVTDKARLRPVGKLFNFKMHPAGARHLVDIGFNLFSTANNHAIDYGQSGMRETVRHLTALKREGLLAFPGVGRGRDALTRAALVSVKQARIAVLALGIGGVRVGATHERYGQLGYSSMEDFDAGVRALAAATSDYRMLSVHYGQELQIRPSSAAIRKLRDKAVRDAGIDLVVGHHAHVAAGVQRIDNKLIFYGLGNLVHLGMQNMAKFGACRDFGLLARVFLARDTGGRLQARAVQVVPLTNMHDAARPLKGSAAAKRIAVLNGLARGLDAPGARAYGLRFRPQADGTGLHCLEGARSDVGRIGQLCAGWTEPVDGAGDIRTHGCGARVVANRRRIGRPRATKGPRRRRAGRVVRARGGFVRQYYSRVYGR